MKKYNYLVLTLPLIFGAPLLQAAPHIHGKIFHDHTGFTHPHGNDFFGKPNIQGNSKSPAAKRQNTNVKPSSELTRKACAKTNSHSHAGRVHNHAFPKQGVYHKHGNGATGKCSEGVKAKKGTVKKKVGVAKPPKIPANLNGFYMVTESGAMPESGV